MTFKDRHDAAIQLAQILGPFKNNKDAIVLGLPRGGVVVAHYIAEKLNLPVDIIVTRKMGAPMSPELAVGSITQEGEPLFDKKIMDITNYKKEDLQEIIEKEKKELERRLKLYRAHKPPLHLKNKIAIIVDDGIATGCTMHAAIKTAKCMGAKEIIVAVPVGPVDICEQLKREVDDVVCVHKPITFDAIGFFYDQFSQVTDDEVIRLLGT
jgi:putative phosphoribosyl transferase